MALVEERPPEAVERGSRTVRLEQRRSGRRRLGFALALMAVVAAAAGATLYRTGVLQDQTAAPALPARVVVQPAATAADVPVARTPRTLRVITHPEGARVTLRGDGTGRRTGTTPSTFRLPAEAVTVTIAMDGRNTLERTVDLRDGSRTIDVWLDPKGLLHHKLGGFDTGSAPKQVAFTPDGKEIWVTDLGGDGVEVFGTYTRNRLAHIPLGQHGAVEVIFTADGRTAYASQMETASVFEIDRATRKVRRRLDTGGVWSKVMALSPDEKRLYVANWSSSNVSEIDLATGRVVRLLPTVPTPRGLYATPDGKRLFVAGYGNGEIQRISLVSGESKVLLQTGGAMRHLVGDAEGGSLYADDMATDEVFVVDLATESVRKLADTNNTPNTMDLSPDGRVLYVSNRGRNNPMSYYVPGPEWGSVLAIDTSTGKILDAIVGGNQTTGLDVSPNGRLLAYSDFLDNRVTIYAVPSYEELRAGGGGRAQSHLADLQK